MDLPKILNLNLNLNLTFSNITLALACLITGYLANLALTPPNPNPENADVDDRYRHILTPRTIARRKLFYTVLSVYHAVLVLTQPGPDSVLVCPFPSNLNHSLLLTWSSYMILGLGMVCFIGVPLRLAAYRALGRNFTFTLQKPSELNTRGLYRWMQHPSYTSAALVRSGCLCVFLRWDGVLGCWIPPAIRAWLDGCGWVVVVFMAIVVVHAVRGRVSDEEKMLQEKFGDLWVEWHRRTKRFVPGLF
jgi:protein-S-isoprenylcysteine O-methyltransferase Ste14